MVDLLRIVRWGMQAHLKAHKAKFINFKSRLWCPMPKVHISWACMVDLSAWTLAGLLMVRREVAQSTGPIAAIESCRDGCDLCLYSKLGDDEDESIKVRATRRFKCEEIQWQSDFKKLWSLVYWHGFEDETGLWHFQSCIENQSNSGGLRQVTLCVFSQDTETHNDEQSLRCKRYTFFIKLYSNSKTIRSLPSPTQMR